MNWRYAMVGSCVNRLIGMQMSYLKGNLNEKNVSPNVGLEPTTLRLRVSCSTD